MANSERGASLAPEKRIVATSELRLLPAGDGKPVRIAGYAVKYGALSSNLGGFKERIAKGAFRESIASGRDILALVGHDDALILGRTSAGTLRVRDDDVGVYFEVSLPRTTYGADLAESIRRGDVRGSSFGFSKVDDSWTYEGSQRVRIVHRAILHEVSPTAIPAYEDTSVALRTCQSLEQQDTTIAGRMRRLDQIEADMAKRYGYPSVEAMRKAYSLAHSLTTEWQKDD